MFLIIINYYQRDAAQYIRVSVTQLVSESVASSELQTNRGQQVCCAQPLGRPGGCERWLGPGLESMQVRCSGPALQSNIPLPGGGPAVPRNSPGWTNVRTHRCLRHSAVATPFFPSRVWATLASGPPVFATKLLQKSWIC